MSGHHDPRGGERRRDYTVVKTAKAWSVRGRLSVWQLGEWHWLDGWHVGSYRTERRARAEANKLNRSWAALLTSQPETAEA